MITWTDNFSSDHFTDDYYTPLEGTVGVNFAVAGGVLTVDNYCGWFDENTETRVSVMTMTVQNPAAIGVVEMGLIDPTNLALGAAGVVEAGGLLVVSVTNGSDLDSNSGAWTPPDGPMTVTVTITNTDVTVTVPGGECSVAIDLTLQADLPDTMVPFAVVSGTAVVCTQWTYTTTGGGGHDGGGGGTFTVPPEPFQIGTILSGIMPRPRS